jgi:hypothetical protein
MDLFAAKWCQVPARPGVFWHVWRPRQGLEFGLTSDRCGSVFAHWTSPCDEKEMGITPRYSFKEFIEWEMD